MLEARHAQVVAHEAHSAVSGTKGANTVEVFQPSCWISLERAHERDCGEGCESALTGGGGVGDGIGGGCTAGGGG